MSTAILVLTLLAAEDVTVHPHIIDIFKPLPKTFDNAANPASEGKVTLGRMLYFDKRLSKNHDIACASCHDLQKFGVDGERFSKGHKGQRGGRNAPTVYNSGGHVAQFWDGRAADLEAQAQGPILNPVEMAMTEKRTVATVASIPAYVDLFKKAFPAEKKPVTYQNLARAIAAFERGLQTPGRFDRFLAGDAKALTNAEKRGLVKFFEYGCRYAPNVRSKPERTRAIRAASRSTSSSTARPRLRASMGRSSGARWSSA